MKERIAAFIKAESKTSIQFAEEIGVQPSSVSHIISGRNNPSLDFVLKMLKTYEYISNEWLLFGKGKMYKNEPEPTLFDKDDSSDIIDYESNNYNGMSVSEGDIDRSQLTLGQDIDLSGDDLAEKRADNPDKRDCGVFVEKIVWFYNDNSFRVFEEK